MFQTDVFTKRYALYLVNMSIGIMDTPRSCLHSLLLIANRGFPSRQTSKGLVSMPATTELAYHLVYMLCANKDTSGPVMRYLRSTDDFFYKHLQKVPCNISNEGKCSLIKHLL